MTWSEMLNPWAVIRQLRFEKAALEQKCEELWERADEAESIAFHRASEHWYQRMRMQEARADAAMKQLTDLAALQPLGPIIFKNPQGDPPQ